MQHTRSLHLTHHLHCTNAFQDPKVVSHKFVVSCLQLVYFCATNVEIHMQLLTTSVEGNYFIFALFCFYGFIVLSAILSTIQCMHQGILHYLN